MEKEHCHCSSEHSEFDGNMPDDNVLYVVSELFKVFGDTTRIKILFLPGRIPCTKENFVE